jgi:hypothetical protein
MTDCVGKFWEPLSNGLCNKQLAFGNWHDSAYHIVTNPLKVNVALCFFASKSACCQALTASINH